MTAPGQCCHLLARRAPATSDGDLGCSLGLGCRRSPAAPGLRAEGHAGGPCRAPGVCIPKSPDGCCQTQPRLTPPQPQTPVLCPIVPASEGLLQRTPKKTKPYTPTPQNLSGSPQGQRWHLPHFPAHSRCKCQRDDLGSQGWGCMEGRGGSTWEGCSWLRKGHRSGWGPCGLGQKCGYPTYGFTCGPPFPAHNPPLSVSLCPGLPGAWQGIGA